MDMFRGEKKIGIYFGILVFLLVTLACGSSTSPTLVSTALPPVVSDTQQEQPTQQVQLTQPEQPIQTEQQQPTQAPVTARPNSYKVGDVISIGDNVLSVLGWKQVPAGDFDTLEQGKKFVAVELILVNNGQIPNSISTLLQMSLKDASSQKYTVQYISSLTNTGSVDGELSAGEKIRGVVGFQIPETANGLQFVFDDSVFGTGKIFVDLPETPAIVEPSADFPGEKLQQEYKVGDVVPIGTTALTVNEVLFPAGSEYNRPADGYRFVVVDITIDNQSTAAINISTILQMAVKDEKSYKYGMDFTASMASGGTTPDGELAPGEKLRGQVGFQVPATVTSLVFVFDAEIWGTGKIFIALN